MEAWVLYVDVGELDLPVMWCSEWGAVFYVGPLGWQDLVEREQPRTALWDLAKAILLLFDKLDIKDRTDHLLLTIMEELIGIIVHWFSNASISHYRR